MRRLLFAACLAMAGCGMKAPPVAVDPNAPPPAIEDFSWSHEKTAVRFVFRLTGGAGGVGYEIDRARIDPVCRCPTMWRRYFEQVPSASLRGKKIVRLLKLRKQGVVYLFRIRAVDAEGRFGRWIGPIRAEAEVDE